jgi:SAM-dependent methyltransferase
LKRAPSAANAIDIFAGHWAIDLSKINPAWRGGSASLEGDNRAALAARSLGHGGRLDGMRVLELGPLEAIHTHQLGELGAREIVSIEANIEAYLKCLIMKEVLGIDAQFLLGDFIQYLAQTNERFDLVFCSGVLYHMEDPLALIRDIARVSERCFVWTHYYDPQNCPGPQRERVPATLDGFAASYFRLDYPDRDKPNFWGGNRPSSSWMARSDILSALHYVGFDRVEVLAEEPKHPNGACFSIAAERSRVPSARAARSPQPPARSRRANLPAGSAFPLR